MEALRRVLGTDLIARYHPYIYLCHFLHLVLIFGCCVGGVILRSDFTTSSLSHSFLFDLVLVYGFRAWTMSIETFIRMDGGV